MTSKEPFDWVKWGGIALCIAVFLGGQMYIVRRNRELAVQQQALAEADADKRAKDDAARRTQAALDQALTKTGVVSVGPEQIAAGLPVSPGGDEKPPQEPVAAPAVSVKSNVFDLTFTARGGALERAVLSGLFMTAASRDQSQTPGLDVLNEIDSGRLSLAMMNVKLNDIMYAGFETKTWELVENSTGFTGPQGRWAVTYAATVRDQAAPYAPIARITKRFLIGQTVHDLGVDITVTNLSKRTLTYEYALRGPAGILMDGPPHDPQQGAYAYIRCAMASRAANEDAPTITVISTDTAKQPDEIARSTRQQENLWASVTNRFFMAALISKDPTRAIKVVTEPIGLTKRTDKPGDNRYLMDNVSPVMYRRLSNDLPAGETSAPESYALYVGPSDEALLIECEKALELPRPAHLNLGVMYCDVFNYTWPRVDWISRQLLWVFNGFHALTNSWGLGIILLTIFIKLCLHPIQRKQMVSMHKMQALKPLLDAVEKKYEGQTGNEARQKKELEKLDVMRKAGANPLMGCLPMLLQMPIFFALFGTFSHAYEIRQASFLWCHDLALQDAAFMLNFWPHEVNIFPILYIFMTLGQSFMQPRPAGNDPQAEMNRKMMLFMPAFFGLLIYRMPAGLLVYFAASATFGMLESWYIKKFVIKAAESTRATAPGQVPALFKK